APVVRRWKNPAVPESENRAMTRLKNFIEVSIADRLPTHRQTDQPDDNIADPANHRSLQNLAARKPSIVIHELDLLEQLCHLFAVLAFANPVGEENPETNGFGDYLFGWWKTFGVANLFRLDGRSL